MRAKIWLRSASIYGFVVGLICVIAAVPAQAQRRLDTVNSAGILRTISLDKSPLNQRNAFFANLGTNGRSCGSCHVASTGWTISPQELNDRFEGTRGLDPIFSLNDGANSPHADVSTLKSRRQAYSMLISKGLIRVGLPVPANAEFELIHVEDPYHYASAMELSLFRRPMPTTNLRFLTGVMWDARESFAPMGTLPFLSTNTPMENAMVLFGDLKHQANDATTGHAQSAQPLTDDQATAIVNFELNLATAQQYDDHVGSLSADGADGGAENVGLQLFYVTINDVLGADVLDPNDFISNSMTLYKAWKNSPNRHRASIARGAKLFGTMPISITGVGGLNDALNLPVIAGTCTTCHDSPNIGNHSVALPIDIGLTDDQFRTPDMPRYTLKNKITGATRATSDPGRALLTGKWADIGKFKGPILRGLASRPPYFHNGKAADFGEVLDFYNTRFGIGITNDQRHDLIAFLKTL